MRLFQTALTAVTLSLILSACGEGNAVTESGQVANMTDQETAVSSGGGETIELVAPPATTPSEPITTPITTPTTTPITRPTKPTPVSSSPTVTTPVSNNSQPVVVDPVEVYGAATLTTASISGDNIVLGWNQTNDNPESGYNIVVDGAVSADLRNIAGTSATVEGLDLSVQHCFQVRALYSQADPAEYYTSNSLCTNAQQASNQAPVISGNPSNSVDAGSSYSFTPNASDGDDDDLTFSVTNLPAWAQFNSQTGRISGSPAEDDVGDYNNIVIAVSDGTDEDRLTAFSITVNSTAATTGSISLRWVAPTSRTDGSLLSLSEIQGYCVYVGTTRDNLQMVADINQSDSTSYVVENLDLGDYYVAVTVYDQDDNMSGLSNVVMKTAMN